MKKTAGTIKKQLLEHIMKSYKHDKTDSHYATQFIKNTKIKAAEPNYKNPNQQLIQKHLFLAITHISQAKNIKKPGLLQIHF